MFGGAEDVVTLGLHTIQEALCVASFLWLKISSKKSDLLELNPSPAKLGYQW